MSLSNIFKTVSLAWTGAPVKASATVEISSAKEGYRPSSTKVFVKDYEILKNDNFTFLQFSLRTSLRTLASASESLQGGGGPMVDFFWTANF